MNVLWKEFRTPDEVKQYIRANIPALATITDIRAWCVSECLECSDVVENVIYSSAPAHSKNWLIKSQWLIQFQFIGDELKRVEVAEGLTGL